MGRWDSEAVRDFGGGGLKRDIAENKRVLGLEKGKARRTRSNFEELEDDLKRKRRFGS